MAILESAVEPREEILFLAREMTQAPDNGDERIAWMKSALKESLQKMSQNGGEYAEEDSGTLDERYGE